MKRLSVILLSAFLALSISTPVLAFIVAPTSITISNVKAYRNLAATGDELFIFHYSMPYASDNYSSTPASETIMLRLLAADGTTVVQTGVPFVNPFFGSNGYGEGVGAFYLSPSDNITWNSAAIIQIIEMPAFFESPQTQAYTLDTSDYTTETTQEANRLLLKNYILLECDKLQAEYADTGVILKSTSDIGVILSPYGDLYFQGAVSGLQNLCPDLFFIQSVAPTEMTIQTYNMSLQTTLTNRLTGDDLGRGFDRMGNLINVSGATFGGILVIGVTLGAAIWTSRKGWGAEVGIGIGCFFAVLMALLVGSGVFTLVMIASLLAGIGIVWLTLLKRA